MTYILLHKKNVCPKESMVYSFRLSAGVAELADAHASEACGSNTVEVQVLSSAHQI